MHTVWDKIIIGAGLYGLYAALRCGKRGEKILVLEYDSQPFMRATYINQARVHMGYHYPRSYSTAIKSANYFKRFVEDFGFCIHSKFEQIYAVSSDFSWTTGKQFKKFCHSADIKCEEISTDRYFNKDMCENAFLTEEYTYDAHILRDHYMNEIRRYENIQLMFNVRIEKIIREYNSFHIYLSDHTRFSSDFILNATYASVNQILSYLEFEPFNIKYELCEIILCEVSDNLQNKGITVMDGPFFSLMPFGKTGMHSLTSVTFTPHMTGYENMPSFPCQRMSRGMCTSMQLANCNQCDAKPESAWDYMSRLSGKYLRKEYAVRYGKSLFSMKPILKASEIDDSRPTVIKVFSENPTFISVLSGKINTVYDLDEVLG